MGRQPWAPAVPLIGERARGLNNLRSMVRLLGVYSQGVMIRIHGRAFGLSLPALSAVFIGSELFQRLEVIDEAIGHQEGLEVFL
jgi:hypothetical protein